MSFYQEETIYCLQGSEIAYFLQGKALQEINCFRSLQEINLFLPSKTHDIPCLQHHRCHRYHGTESHMFHTILPHSQSGTTMRTTAK